MSDIVDSGQFGGRLGLRPNATRQRPKYAISRRVFSDGLLYFLIYFCLVRATGMWLGYPPTQDENATVDSMPQQLMLYSLIPITGLYILLNPKRVLGYLREIPPLVIAFGLVLLMATVFSVDFVASARGLTAVVVISMTVLLFKLRLGSV